MKKPIISFAAILVMITLFDRCAQEENEDPALEEIQFSFSIPADDDAGGRTKSQEIPPHASLLLSLEKTSGELVFTHQRIKILSFGDSYITEPIELQPGYYSITDFMIVSDSSEVLYATPKQGSPLAGAVNRPLPYNIFVGRNKVSNIDMQVIDVRDHQPENFGYASFNIHAGTTFQISVFRFENNKVSFTDANGYITKGRDTLHIYPLSAKVNIVFFEGDPEETYTLTVRKNGYQEYKREFNFNDLKRELNGGPLEIFLFPVTDQQAKLKEFVMDPRHYELYYNGVGEVDSIVAHEGSDFRYVYRVTYTGGRIDSVSTIDGGQLVSTHDDFEYDDEGRIIYYNYHYRTGDVPNDVFVPTSITYDTAGHIKSIDGESFTYDNQNNIIAGFDATFTYDNGLNPFYRIKNLFAIVVEEPFLWESILSEHNATSKTFAQGSPIPYINEYDANNRLVSKAGTRIYYYE